MFCVYSFSLFSILLFSVTAFAMPVKFGCGTHDCSKCHTLTVKEAAEILKPLNVEVQSIKQAPISGMFEVLAKRSDQEGVIYVDFAKKKIMQGVIVNLQNMEAISSHSKEPPQLQKIVSIDYNQIPLKYGIIMGNQAASKRLIIFTDPDCPYCRNLHSELIKLEKEVSDIAIYIMLYPSISHSQAYNKCRFLVASKNKDLLNNAFEGKKTAEPKNNEGKLEIDKIIEFAHKNGIHATPTIVLPSGKIITGTRDINSLKKLISVL